MLPGPTIYRECPHCSKVFTSPSLASGNTFGATHWSDGKLDAPMLPEFSQIVRCPECNGFIWLEEAKIAGEFDWFNAEKEEKPKKEWENARSTIDPSIEDFAIALEEGQASSKEKEKYLRMQLWWNLNDPVRNGERSTTLPPVNEELFFDNLKHLDRLMADDSPDDQIMKAEIARECGEFEKCKLLMTGIPEKYASVCDQIRKLADEGNPVVQKINM